MSKYETISTMVRACQACPLSFRGAGVPGEYVGPGEICCYEHEEFGTCRCAFTSLRDVMVILEAPGGVEQEAGRPVWGSSGQLFRTLMAECGIENYYVTNVAKHRPYVVKGKQQKPDAQALKACSGFLDAEIKMVRPSKLILCGNVAASKVLGIPGNTAQASIVNRVFEASLSYGDVPALVLYHPAYFLHNRTASFVNRGLNDFKRALRNFMGADIPHYPIEEVKCPAHP